MCCEEERDTDKAEDEYARWQLDLLPTDSYIRDSREYWARPLPMPILCLGRVWWILGDDADVGELSFLPCLVAAIASSHGDHSR